MMKPGKFISIAVGMIISLPLMGEEMKITLQEAIAIAKVQSVDAAVAINELRSAYWQYRSFRADQLPEINLSASLPNYNRNYDTYQQEDGSYTYVRNNYLGMDGTLSIDQNIPFTGGKVSINTSLDYLKQMDNRNGKLFMSIPFALTYSQPIMGTNRMKWERKIQPVKYREAQAKFASDMEEITMRTINYYFNLLLAKENLNISRQNLANSRKLHEAAKAKRKMGQISENDLLQMELNVLDSQSELSGNGSSLHSAMFQLRSFLGLDSSVVIEPVIPHTFECPPLSYEDVLQKALANNHFSQNILRRKLEAQYEVAAAKGDIRSITLFAQVGYTGTGEALRRAYSNLNNNQVIQVGVKMPILDWGKRRGRVKMAQSNQEMVESRLKQESLNFNQNIFIVTEQFNNQMMLLQNASLADTIARKRYRTNVETFLAGKISTLDLNDSQTRKDRARQKYLNEMFWWWYYYYQIRSITLWDYINEAPIMADFDKTLNL